MAMQSCPNHCAVSAVQQHSIMQQSCAKLIGTHALQIITTFIIKIHVQNDMYDSISMRPSLPPPPSNVGVHSTHASYSFAVHYSCLQWFWGAGNRLLLQNVPTVLYKIVVWTDLISCGVADGVINPKVPAIKCPDTIHNYGNALIDQGHTLHSWSQWERDAQKWRTLKFFTRQWCIAVYCSIDNCLWSQKSINPNVRYLSRTYSCKLKQGFINMAQVLQVYLCCYHRLVNKLLMLCTVRVNIFTLYVMHSHKTGNKWHSG